MTFFYNADMAKLVDALVLGTSGQPWEFESLYPHQINAVIAQLVEQLISNHQVGSSNLSDSTIMRV